MDRREFISAAAALGATAMWATRSSAASRLAWREDRGLYPQGVASGDPDEQSVILWTRRPFTERTRADLNVEVSLDSDFKKVVATARAPVLAESDWTCRALVGGLKPATVYWYRFTDETGAGSRVGRTITAPRLDDPRTVRFAFVSCQSVNEGAQNAFRRMIWEDERAPADRKLGFVLHLGDFIYEVVEYPEEVAHRYGRTVYDIGKVPNARKVSNFHVPTDVAGYRAVYQAHIRDSDIQDARAHFPFVCMGDNHEFSWKGYQSFIQYDGDPDPAQELRVAANQAWWEYIPSRVRKASGPGLEAFNGPTVKNTPINQFDDGGLGVEPNNLTALGSMTAYRALRYGRNVELIITDMHAYMMQDPTSRPEVAALDPGDYPNMFPQEWTEVLDGGRAYNDGKPPEAIMVGDKAVPNFRKDEAPMTLLGRQQKAWFKSKLAESKATWKVWAATNPTLDWRFDPQNLPSGLAPKPWPVAGYACTGGGDMSGSYHERAELYDFVRDRKIGGLVTVSGDRHSFWAGYSAKALPPQKFEPVGVAFVTGSISAPGMAEAMEYGLKKHPLRALFAVEREGGRYEATCNLTLKRGVRSALEYAKSGDIEAARRLTNPDNAPHLEFIDMGGHGYSVVTAASDKVQTEFVCIPRPITRATTPDGGPLRYRVRHTANLWKPGEQPRLKQEVIEGDVSLSV